MSSNHPIHPFVAEYLGTALLMLVVAGSGIMGESLSQGNAALALLANSLATGCGLYVLITLLVPISGAHFNPLVSILVWRKNLMSKTFFGYVLAQLLGAISGVWLTHVLFSLPVFQLSLKVRDGLGIWVSEFVSTLILISVIYLGVKYSKEKLPMLVAMSVTAGYWFTSSTFFANPAITLARSLTNTFVGISPLDIVGFIAAQFVAILFILFLTRKS
ncbi:MAG: aquaporin family protein [Methylotenera sp.]|nr:MAG: aquaporin family protein [Methylotenera sp.]